MVNKNAQTKTKSNIILFYFTPMMQPTTRVEASSKDAPREKISGSEVASFTNPLASLSLEAGNLSSSEVAALKFPSSSVIVGEASVDSHYTSVAPESKLITEIVRRPGYRIGEPLISCHLLLIFTKLPRPPPSPIRNLDNPFFSEEKNT